MFKKPYKNYIFFDLSELGVAVAYLSFMYLMYFFVENRPYVQVEFYAFYFISSLYWINGLLTMYYFYFTYNYDPDFKKKIVFFNKTLLDGRNFFFLYLFMSIGCFVGFVFYGCWITLYVFQLV